MNFRRETKIAIVSLFFAAITVCGAAYIGNLPSAQAYPNLNGGSPDAECQAVNPAAYAVDKMECSCPEASAECVDDCWDYSDDFGPDHVIEIYDGEDCKNFCVRAEEGAVSFWILKYGLNRDEYYVPPTEQCISDLLQDASHITACYIPSTPTNTSTSTATETSTSTATETSTSTATETSTSTATETSTSTATETSTSTATETSTSTPTETSTSTATETSTSTSTATYTSTATETSTSTATSTPGPEPGCLYLSVSNNNPLVGEEVTFTVEGIEDYFNHYGKSSLICSTDGETEEKAYKNIKGDLSVFRRTFDEPGGPYTCKGAVKIGRDWYTDNQTCVKQISVQGEPFVPESSTLLFFGSGLLGLAGYAGLRLRSRNSRD